MVQWLRLHASTEGEMDSMISFRKLRSCMPKAWQKKKKKFFFNFQKGTESEDKFKRQMSRVAQIQPWDSVSVTGSRQRKRAYRR